MRMRWLLVLVLLVSAAALPIAWSARRLAAADRLVTRAAQSLREAQQAAFGIDALRQQAQRVEMQLRPEQDVIARINAVLVGCGIPSARFDGLRSESDTALTNRPGLPIQYRRQSVSVSLRSLTPAELGAFLESWRREHPMWVPTRIELAHPRGRGATGANTYDATVIVSALYIDQS